MTTSTAILLPRREQALPAPGVEGRSNRLVTSGYAADGEAAAALFFWSHTRFFSDFAFGLHPHEGFEIVSVILEGRTGHYDTVTDRWYDLNAGDAQIIRSGAGLRHRERAYAGARVFQIWIDPGFATALHRKPSYTDHPAASLPVYQTGDALVTDLIGGEGPMESFTEGLIMRRAVVPAGAHADLGVGSDRFSLAYLIDGVASLNGAPTQSDDAISFNGATSLAIDAKDRADVFIVSLPAHPSYQLVR